MSGINFLERLLDGGAVEWKTLGDVDLFEVASGGTPSKSKSGYWDNGNIPWLKSESCNNEPVYSASNYITELGLQKSSAKLLQRETTLIALVGATIFKTAFLEFQATTNQNIASIKSKCPEAINDKFIFYYITNLYEVLKSEMRNYGMLNLTTLRQFKIPIPPLKIQAEIVRILDTFTALTAELTAELSDRKKQYNYYRDRLLTFEEGEVEWKTLLDACDYVDYRGKTPTKTLEGIFLVTAKNIRVGYIDYEASQEFISEDDYASVMRRGFPKLGDVLITTEAPCGFVAQVDRENIALAQRVIKYRSKDKRLSNSFLKHYLLGSHFQNKLLKTATGSTVKGIKGSKLHQLTIPIPSEAEQARIVALLDKFDTLTTSITEGLPREIALRQQQYEYYRDLLLSFPKTKEEQ